LYASFAATTIAAGAGSSGTLTSRAEPGPAPPSGRPSAHVGLTTLQEASSKDAPRRGRPIPWMRPPPDRPLSAIGIMAPGCVNLGGRALVGPMGRGVPREEPAVHLAGRQPAGRVHRVELEGTFAGSRGFSRRRGPCPTGIGASPARAGCTLPIDCWPGSRTPSVSSVNLAHYRCWSRRTRARLTGAQRRR